MKKILVKDLKEGDVFYFRDTYRVALSDVQHHRPYGSSVKVKCIMSPMPTKERREGGTWFDIGTVTYMVSYLTVTLLVRDGKEV